MLRLKARPTRTVRSHSGIERCHHFLQVQVTVVLLHPLSSGLKYSQSHLIPRLSILPPKASLVLRQKQQQRLLVIRVRGEQYLRRHRRVPQDLVHFLQVPDRRLRRGGTQKVGSRAHNMELEAPRKWPCKRRTQERYLSQTRRRCRGRYLQLITRNGIAISREEL